MNVKYRFSEKFEPVLSKQLDTLKAEKSRENYRAFVEDICRVSKKDFLEKRISEELEGLMDERRNFVSDGSQQLIPVEGSAYNASIASPIISNGDVLGAVVFLWSDGTKITPVETKLAQVAASFLGRQMEE